MKFVWLTSTSILIAILAIGLESGSEHLPTDDSDNRSGDRTSAIFAPGRVEGASSEVALRSQLSGRIAKVSVRVGEQVVKNDLLLQIEPGQYVAAVRLAEAQVRAAEGECTRLLNGSHEEERRHAAAARDAKVAQLQQAQRTWERFSQLSAAGAVTAQESELRQSELRVMEAEALAAEARVRLLESPPRADEVEISRAKIEAAKAQLDMARCRLAQTELRAPMTGRILSIDVREGEIVGPNDPQPAISMADTRGLRVRAFVDEYDAMRVSPGMPARIKLYGLADRAFDGQITELSPIMRQKQFRTNAPNERLDTETREVWIALGNETGLVVGARVDVVIDCAK